jgi:hypothetical protein
MERKRLSLIKIDLCGSKTFADTHKFGESSVRETILSSLAKKAKTFFPYASEAYPKGSLYSAQGDCIYIVLEKPTVALRSTIEFMKDWYSMLPSLPDCRAIIDYGEIIENIEIGRLELLGEPFENISVIEKNYTSGQIGVTEELINNVDETLVQFINKQKVAITSKRNIFIYLVNYENPRLLTESSIVHALFISSPVGDDIRNTVFEAIIIEHLLENENKPINVRDIPVELAKKNCPNPGIPKLEQIVKASQFFDLTPDLYLTINSSQVGKIKKCKDQFDEACQKSLDIVASSFSKELKIDKSHLLRKISVLNLNEEFLCSIFLEIRFMANYFRSTKTLFEKLDNSSEFDYILKKYFYEIIENDPEKFLLVKTTFLRSLKELATSHNIYVASIFHNVLMLYYLNRNSRFAYAQLKKIESKEIFLDTNTFYAYRCNSSDYFEMLRFILDKMTTMKAKVIIFDKSLQEFNDSIEYTLLKYKKSKGVSYVYDFRRPWIWKEYESNRVAYRNDFEYCVAVHKLPQDYFFGKPLNMKTAEEELRKDKINLAVLEPFYEKDQLGKIYNDVYKAKKKYNPIIERFEPKGTPETYHLLVLHDANCLKKTFCEGINPLDCKKLFITCDYSLSKIRKYSPHEYNYLVTINEFYEFMLPYFFLSDAITSSPVEMPNFLLASALSLSLYQTYDFNSLVGAYLANHLSTKQNYSVLAQMESNKRFDKIRESLDKIHQMELGGQEPDDKSIKSYIIDTLDAVEEYKNKVKEKVVRSLIYDSLIEKDRKLEEALKEKEELKRKVERLEFKKKKRDRYLRKQAKRKGKK